MTMPILPANVHAYKRTPEFDQDSIPKGLLNQHATKVGVWALIHVLAGRLKYHISATGEVFELTPQQQGVIEPQVLHHVEPVGAVRFLVEFYAASERPTAEIPSSGLERNI